MSPHAGHVGSLLYDLIYASFLPLTLEEKHSEEVS